MRRLIARWCVSLVGAFFAAVGIAVLAIAPAGAQVPGHCVANCPGDQPTEREPPDRPEHPPGWKPYFGPSPEQQAFEKSTAAFRATIDRLNQFIDTVNAGSRFDQSVRNSVLVIFGGSAGHFAPRQSGNVEDLESDVRGFVHSYPGLKSASLYQTAIPELDARTAAIENNTRQIQTLREDIADWYRRHPGPVTEAEYKNAVAERVAQLNEAERTAGRLYQQARNFWQRADAAENQTLMRLHLPQPTTPPGTSRFEAAAADYARQAVPLSLEEANLEKYSLDMLIGSQPQVMPDWSRGPGAAAQIAPWYAQYSGQTAFADIVPQPPGPDRRSAAPDTPERASANVDGEIRELASDVGQLSDAVASYDAKHKRWTAADDADYRAQTALRESSQPALWSMHIEALNAYFDKQKRDYLKDLHENLATAIRDVLWENLAHQASGMAYAKMQHEASGIVEIHVSRETAMRNAVLLVPAVKQFAEKEFEEIMKGPAVIVHGDAGEAAELQDRIDAHVCELMSSGLPWMDEKHLPAFSRGYIGTLSCSRR